MSDGFFDVEDQQPISRTTSAGVHPYSSAAASSAAVQGTHGARAATNEGEIRPEDVPQQQPPPKPPLYKRRWFIITSIVAALLGIAILFILLYPVIHAIAQHIVTVSVLNIDRAQITSPTNGSFALTLDSWVSHAGIIPATITFNQPLSVGWYNASGAIVPLGSFTLDPLKVKSKRAYINQTVPFTITDEANFALFTSSMITQPNFKWHLTSEKLDVRALAFPTAHDLHFNKDLVLQGMNNFNGNVSLVDFKLPADDPAGGIKFEATTGLNNPSAFDVNLGTVVFDLSYKGLFLGRGTGPNTVISPGANNITLSGSLVPHITVADLATVSELFTLYLNGEQADVVATGVSSRQDDGSAVGWLSAGLTALQLHVPFKAPGAISPIKAIEIGDLALDFTPESEWAPVANSRTVQARMELPFGFGVDIQSIQNSFNITTEQGVVGGLSTPASASTSEIKVVNSTLTQGTINITIENTPLEVLDPNHPVFSSFNLNLTDSKVMPFMLNGQARAVANTSIGAITLDPIKFNVPSNLQGLQGLQSLVQIKSVDVLGGSLEAIHLGIDVDIFNPSNLQLATGDMSLQLLRDGAVIGTTLLPNLTLNMGNNSLSAQGNFTPNDSPQGLETLGQFVGGVNVQVAIAGYLQSTKVESLLAAFESLNIDATLPALSSKLLNSASLQVLSTTAENNISHTTVSLANPFTAALEITHISSNITFQGISLGTIDDAVSFSSAGKSTTTSPALNLNLNMDPQSLFTVTKLLAEQAGEDTAPLDQIVALGGYHYLNGVGGSKRAVDSKRDNIFTNFDLPSFVDKAFTKLAAEVALTAGVTIGDYPTTLSYTQPNVTIKTDESLNLILPVLAQPIVQNIVSGSVLGIETVVIKDVQENSFGTTLKGSITNAGPFDAKIAFPEGLTIVWNDKPLGSIKMPDVDVVGGVGASFEVDTTFAVADVAHLADFTKTMLTAEEFDWVISGSNLSVAAIGISVPGIVLGEKKVTLKGMNGLKGGVKIETFDLPSNDPAGGVHLTLQTNITNPSQVGVELSSIAFQSFFENVNIGPVASTNSFTLSPMSTVALPLAGRLVPQKDDAGLAAVSAMFNAFIHGNDSNIVVQGDSAGPTDVSWLNDGIKALQVQTVLPNRGVLNIINSVSLNSLDLRFTQDSAFSPAFGSNDTTAAFALPFAFPIDITAVGQTISIGTDGADFATVAIPKGPSTTDVDTRVIHLAFTGVPFDVADGQHAAFEQFLSDTATGKSVTMRLSGAANTDASTAIGVLSLTDIEFVVESTVAGLQGLNAKPSVVTSLDVSQGFADFLLIKVTSDLFNPSNITLGAGDIAFELEFQNDVIGQADLSNLVIMPGNTSYPIDVHFQPQGGAVASGQKLLENFLQGVDSDTTIQGSTSSTPIESLQLAMSKISLTPVIIPALHQNLITTASLIFPTDIVQTGIAQTTFTLANPFTAALNLLDVTATATLGNLTLGKIDHVDRSSDPIHADGHANITSPTLPFAFNLEPAAIISLLATGAQKNGVDLGPLSAAFQLALQNPDVGKQVNTSVDTGSPPCVSGKQFDVNDAILNALKNLEVTLAIDSSVKIDDFPIDLSFTQNNVNAITDKTALYLIGAVAPPIVQTFVNQAELKFTEANITNISDDGFDLSLVGSLTGTGPFDAQIEFVDPVKVTWQGNDIATIALPPVCASANDGVPDYRTSGRLSITDQDQFTNFATFLLHNPDFEWTISTGALRLTALGTVFDNVQLSKDVSFKAFNNLPGVTISNFQLPSDDPAGGIHIETDSLIPSSAQIGIDLGTVTFEAGFKGTTVGPLSGSNLFLAAGATVNLHLSGRITPKSGNDLDAMGDLFTNFLHAENQTLQVQGESVQPSGSSGPVSWLSTAFKTLTLDVTLPGQKFDIIQSIEMSDLELVMTEQSEAFAPKASSQNVLAEYKNPFGFSLQVVKSAEDITLASQGVDIAKLELPQQDTDGGVSTGNSAPLNLPFQDQTLQSLNDAAFVQFFAAVTDTADVSFQLNGSADVVARTPIGDIPISGIPFGVTTALKGINAFNKAAQLSNISIAGGGTDSHGAFILSPITTVLENPSNISLSTVDVELPVFFKGVQLGRAVIDPLDLVPGENTLHAEFHYAPNDANDTTAQGFVTELLQTGDTIPLTIKGDSESSPFASLASALEGVEIDTSITGLSAPPIVTHINAFITLDTLVTNLITIDFDIANPLDTDMEITALQVDSGLDGVTYAQFSASFDSFVIPAHSTANSGTVQNVLLTKGAIASLGIIPVGKLDVFSAATAKIGPYTLPWLQLTVPGVPTDYHLDLFAISKAAKSVSAVSGPETTAASTASAKTSAAESNTVAASSTTNNADSTPAASSTDAAENTTSASADSAQSTSSA
ncbi:uncharacterized protein BXZ73DRAFT_100865 [Epithele typhae]|uniref:uncharacterized protein n=1 Tax=Epithele typhae TaxID=378194 RepID=UPI002007CCA1|nr:uncharacterized protein BXZ73DRAFT_100865 [Epithele typhae]KAH9934026.1 hypothetical protein BXZ73DRAFT_100865 [Epithele typhae]